MNMLSPIWDWLAWPARSGWRWPRIETYEFEELPLVDELPERRWHQLSSRSIDLLISGSLTLAKNVEVPRKSRKHTEQILKLKAEALLSGSRSALEHVIERTGRTGTSDAYRITHVKSSDVNALREQFEAKGLSVRHVFVKGSKGPILLQKTGAAFTLATFWWAVALICLNVGFIWAWFVFLDQAEVLEAEVQSAQAELQFLQVQLAEANERDTAAEARFQQLLRLQAKFQLDQQLLPRLLDLTSTLPTDSWLNTLSFQPNEVRLQGATSAEAGDVIEALSALSWAETPALVTPIFTDRRRGTQHFELVLKLSGENE